MDRDQLFRVTVSPALFDKIRAFAHAAHDLGEEANTAQHPDLPAQVADLYHAVENPDFGGVDPEEATAVRIVVTARSARILADDGTYDLLATLLNATSDETPDAGPLLAELDVLVDQCAERFGE